MVVTDTPGTAFEKIALDIVGLMHFTSKGNKYILTMQCLLSKYCIRVQLPDATAKCTAKALVKRFVCVYGCPKVILTDQGKIFLINLMRILAKSLRIQQLKTTAFHPRTNGSLERSHHVLAEFLKQFENKDEE